MSNQIVLKSFADLALVLRLEEAPQQATADTATEPTSTELPDLNRVLADLTTAAMSLTEASRKDEQARATALETLAQYDALVAARQEAEQALDQARAIREQAEALAANAFTDDARAEAGRVLGIAQQAEAVAAQLAEERRAEAETLACQFNLSRLLAERRRQEEAQRARADEVKCAALVADTIASAEVALRAGNWEAARAALDCITHVTVDSPEVKELRQRITQREFAVRVTHADEALWAARRAFRRDPAAALGRLENLDVDGLPDALSRQIFGTWARACARLCQERQMADPLRYAPDPGRGVIIARHTTSDAYVVVSALGMGDEWHVGARVAERIVRQSRPLR